MADRAFFQNFFKPNSSADARHHHRDGACNRLSERVWTRLFPRHRLASIDILRSRPRRGIRRRALFRTARRQRLRRRGDFDSVFHSAAYFDVSDKSVFESVRIYRKILFE